MSRTGQIQKEGAVPSLRTRLADLNEHYMVRHECAEALGSIGSFYLLSCCTIRVDCVHTYRQWIYASLTTGTDECREVLTGYLHDGERIVRESCIVALGIADSNSAN